MISLNLVHQSVLIISQCKTETVVCCGIYQTGLLAVFDRNPSHISTTLVFNSAVCFA